MAKTNLDGPQILDVSGSDHSYQLGNGPKTVTIAATSSGNHILLGNGTASVTDHGRNNTIKIGNGPATVAGGQGDHITLGAGNHTVDVLSDVITVGPGRDSFVFDRGTGSHHQTNFSTISGFDPTHDKIDISKSLFGVSSFAQLDIAQKGADTVITNGSHGGLTITLTDVQATRLTARDFKFT